MTPFHRIAYDHFGVLLMVSGERDAEDCEVTKVTAADSEIDLFDMLQPSLILTISERVDAQLCREARRHNAEVQADAFQFMREMRAMGI